MTLCFTLPLNIAMDLPLRSLGKTSVSQTRNILVSRQETKKKYKHEMTFSGIHFLMELYKKQSQRSREFCFFA
jgi:hypothetical protein